MRKRKLLISAVVLVIVLTGAVFLPSLFNGFVNFDDGRDLLENETVRGFSAANIKKMFTEDHGACYAPLVPLSFAVEYTFFKYDPFIYHFTNYVLHILCTVLVFFFVYKLTRQTLPSFMTSLIFGVHPMHVESVAWVTERKDLLCALFYIAALIVYLMYLQKGNKKYYFYCIVLTVLSFLSKPMAITLPLVLLLLDYYNARRIDRAALAEKVPLFVLAAALGAVTMYFQKTAGATGLDADTGVKTYFLSRELVFYLSKFIFPVKLSVMYPYTDIGPAELALVKYYIIALLPVLFLTIFSLRYTRKIMFGMAFFMITIAPVIKVVPMGDVFAADRYMYIPSIGLLFAGAVVLAKLAGERTGWMNAIRPGVMILFSLWAAALSVMTWQRCLVWKDSETLFSDMLKNYRTNPLPYNNIGIFYAEKGDLNTAVEYFKKALEVEPGHDMSLENLALARKKMGKLPEKDPVVIVEKVRELNALGEKKGKAGDLEGAIALFEKAAGLDPGDPETHNNLGYAYYMKGDMERAEGYFRKALELDPGNAKARNNLDFLTEQKKQGEN